MIAEKKLKELLRCIFETQEEEIDGEAWDCQMTRVAEMIAHGEDINTILPAISQYLKNSPDCREELLALVAMMQADETETEL